MKTQDYLDIFARFKQKENIEAVERILSSRAELDLFERSQLGMCWLPLISVTKGFIITSCPLEPFGHFQISKAFLSYKAFNCIFLFSFGSGLRSNN